jgi:hypothetical protein
MRTAAALALLLAATAARADVEVKVDGDRYDVRAANMPLTEVLDRLAKQSGMKVVYEGAPPRTVVTVGLSRVGHVQAVLGVLEGLGVAYVLRTDVKGLHVEEIHVVSVTPSGSPAAASAGPGPGKGIEVPQNPTPGAMGIQPEPDQEEPEPEPEPEPPPQAGKGEKGEQVGNQPPPPPVGVLPGFVPPGYVPPAPGGQARGENDGGAGVASPGDPLPAPGVNNPFGGPPGAFLPPAFPGATPPPPPPPSSRE